VIHGIKSLDYISFKRSQLSMVNGNFSRYISSISRGKARGLHPYFVTGFLDAECSFIISIVLNNKYKTGWRIDPHFSIELHGKDLLLLKQIQSFFGVGSIIVRKSNNQVIFTVTSIKDLTIKIIPHFEKYPLITQKRADYLLFKSVVYLMNRKEHLTQDGLRQIVGLRAAMNTGLSEKQKAAFPNIIPAVRPTGYARGVVNPQWVAGFTTGEGCFIVRLLNSSSNRISHVALVFQITHSASKRWAINEKFNRVL